MAHPRPTRQHRPTTIVIPVRDRPSDLARLLYGVRPLESGTLKGSDPLSVVVVDDGSEVPVAGATIRREVSGGPAVARNEGLRRVTTEFVAFLDSDTVPPGDWIEQLAGHFEDPRVAAVAPRIRALDGKRSPLDMGKHAAEVGPGRHVSYVPAAALLVRRAALPDDPFDPDLRYGEDVDLIWRLIDAGWRVRYDPSVVVGHEERDTLRRRFMYGTSAAALQQRHPGRLKHVIVRPWPAATLALIVARQPRLAALAYAAQTIQLVRTLREHRVPARLAPLWTAKATVKTATQFARLATPYGAGVITGHLWIRTRRPKIRGLPTILGPNIS